MVQETLLRDFFCAGDFIPEISFESFQKQFSWCWRHFHGAGDFFMVPQTLLRDFFCAGDFLWSHFHCVGDFLVANFFMVRVTSLWPFSRCQRLAWRNFHSVWDFIGAIFTVLGTFSWCRTNLKGNQYFINLNQQAAFRNERKNFYQLVFFLYQLSTT